MKYLLLFFFLACFFHFKVYCQTQHYKFNADIDSSILCPVLQADLSGSTNGSIYLFQLFFISASSDVDNISKTLINSLDENNIPFNFNIALDTIKDFRERLSIQSKMLDSLEKKGKALP